MGDIRVPRNEDILIVKAKEAVSARYSMEMKLNRERVEMCTVQ